MKRNLLKSLLAGSFVVAWQGVFAEIHLTKLFYHEGIIGDKLVCYFDQEPTCEHSSKDAGQRGKQEVSFFLPSTVFVDDTVRAAMKKIASSRHQHHSVSFEEVTEAQQGIRFRISYDPSIIVCDYARCTSIGLQKTLIFNLYNKKSLEAVQLYGGSILRYVSSNQVDEKKPRIMLDFGHGGLDTGKVGCNMIEEKNINMQVGMKLAELLRQKGYQVSMTREEDLFVPLDVRTTIANRQRVDLFVSLHANAGHRATASGIETYWTARGSLKRETMGRQHTERLINGVVNELDSASKLLASSIHSELITAVSAKFPVVNRKVKQSVAQVLLGSDMPSALIEMGFLTNPKETKLLTNGSYQNLLAQGICRGIESYCNEIKNIDSGC